MVLAGVVAPATGHLAEFEAPARLVVEGGQLDQRVADAVDRQLHRLRQPTFVDGLVGQQQQRLQRAGQVTGPDGVHLGGAHVPLSTGTSRAGSAAVSNSSDTATAGCSPPVQRTVSSPNGASCSKAT